MPASDPSSAYDGALLTRDHGNAPIVFLDIDGVLNSQQWLRERGQACRRIPRRGTAYARECWDFDPKAVSRLNAFLELSGCEVVVSSTWRKLYELAELEDIFDAVGIHSKPLLGQTPDHSAQPIEDAVHSNRQRGAEIAAWRETFGHVGPFVVFDDDADMDAVEDHFVCILNAVGLQDEDVDEALRILEGQ